MTDYDALVAAAEALVRDVPHPIANLANIAALLYHTLDRINWAGFYLAENGVLVLGPFQGKPACIEIPLGKGVCGTAAERREALTVPDVHAFPGHIACDEASRSELVIPIFRGGAVYGVLDLDSPHPGRFTEEDLAGLSAFVRVLEKNLFSGEETVK